MDDPFENLSDVMIDVRMCKTCPSCTIGYGTNSTGERVETAICLRDYCDNHKINDKDLVPIGAIWTSIRFAMSVGLGSTLKKSDSYKDKVVQRLAEKGHQVVNLDFCQDCAMSIRSARGVTLCARRSCDNHFNGFVSVNVFDYRGTYADEVIAYANQASKKSGFTKPKRG